MSKYVRRSHLIIQRMSFVMSDGEGFLIRQEEGGAPTSPFLTFLLTTPITTSLSSSPPPLDHHYYVEVIIQRPPITPPCFLISDNPAGHLGQMIKNIWIISGVWSKGSHDSQSLTLFVSAQLCFHVLTFNVHKPPQPLPPTPIWWV